MENEIVGNGNMWYEWLPMNADSGLQERRIYTVSELTADIKRLFEDTYPFLWITGEISNFSTPVSGHFYFTLKDPKAQISAVMFQAQNRQLKFRPEDGMAVIGMGRINVYEPRGVYQIILEYLEPAGLGMLQLAFEQLKTKLSAEGLFEERHKIPLPFLPQRIAVVTSPTGAVIRDIIHVINRRFPNVSIEIAPVKVQGEEAAEEIAEAIALFNDRGSADVIVVARGGGSLEDLQSFNSEIVARAIFSSRIPVVSAVGHETDFTIADFAADVRAPTPSAAAELMVPVKAELSGRLAGIKRALQTAMEQKLRLMRERAFQFSKRLIHPRKELANYRLRLDDTFARICGGFTKTLTLERDRLNLIQERLPRRSPRAMAAESNLILEHYVKSLINTVYFLLESRRSRLQTVVTGLNALSPLSILKRGYSLTRTLPDYAVVKDVCQVRIGQQVEVTVSKGGMVCRVERKI